MTSSPSPRRRAAFILALGAAAGVATTNATADIAVETRTDKSAYLSGAENVLVDVIVTNTGPDPATLSFPGWCRAAFDVIESSLAGRLVYQHQTALCSTPPGSITLAAGQSRTYSLAWTLVDFAGRPVAAPADYLIRGFLLTSTRLYSPFVSIRAVTACSDGADNDGDGEVDYPDDPGCHAPADTDERLTDDDLALEVVPSVKGYVTGEVAFFDLRITNRAGETYRRSFSSGCIGFFTVDHPDLFGEAIYDLRRHVICLPVETELVLQPGASQTLPFSWGFVDDAGQPVPSPRAYRLRVSFGYPEALRTADGFAGLDLACSDRLDNDGDGLTDYPADPGCFYDIDNNEFDLFREVKVEVRADRASHPPGDDVFIDVLITNVSDGPVTLTFPCYEVDDQIGFVVQSLQGETIYAPPRGACLPVIDQLTLQPGQTEIALHYWSQQNLAGIPVPHPSQWIIRSVVESAEPVPVDTTTVSIGIGCSDGFDNDLDGLTDYPEDPGCASGTDTDESGPLTLRIDAGGLSWDPAPEAVAYDVARVGIGPTAGVFSVQRCAADNLTETALAVEGAPFPGLARGFVARVVHAGGNGSYDSDSLSQIGSRDPAINASFDYCP